MVEPSKLGIEYLAVAVEMAAALVFAPAALRRIFRMCASGP